MTETHVSKHASSRASSFERTAEILVLAAATLPGLSASAWAQPADALPAPEQGIGEVYRIEQQSPAMQITNITDFVSRWTREQQLYVQGNVPVSGFELQQISDILKAHPNWSVYLVQNAKGQSFVTSDGSSSEDIMAVLNGINTGLAERPQFQGVVDPVTGKQSGAVLMISFDADPEQRKVSYYSSLHQSEAGLGWENWAGNLDQAAIAHLKQKPSNVVGAVRATVEGIDLGIEASRVREAQFQEMQPYLWGAGLLVVAGAGVLVNAGARAARWSMDPKTWPHFPHCPSVAVPSAPRTARIASSDRSDAQVESIRELLSMPARDVSAYLESIVNKQGATVPAEVIEQMDKAGLISILSPEEEQHIRGEAMPYTEAVQELERLRAQGETLESRHNVLTHKLNSVLYRAGHHVTFRWGKLGREENEVRQLRRDEEVLADDIKNQHRVVADLRNKKAEADNLFQIGDRTVHMSSQGLKIRDLIRATPERSSGLSFEAVESMSDRRDEIIRRTNDLGLRHRGYDSSSIASLALAASDSALADVEIDKRLREAWGSSTLSGHARLALLELSLRKDLSLEQLAAEYVAGWRAENLGHSAALHLTAFAADRALPKEPLVEACRRFYKAVGDHWDSAAILTTEAVDIKCGEAELISDWRAAYAVDGLDRLGAAQLAVTARKLEIPISELIDTWKIAYKASGLDSPSAAMLASYSRGKGVPIDRLVGDWREAYARDGIDSLAAANLAISADMGQLPIKGLLEEFSYYYPSRITNARAALRILGVTGSAPGAFSPDAQNAYGSSSNTSPSGMMLNLTVPLLFLYAAALSESRGASSASSYSSSSSSSSMSMGMGSISMGGGGGGGISASGW